LILADEKLAVSELHPKGADGQRVVVREMKRAVLKSLDAMRKDGPKRMQ